MTDRSDPIASTRAGASTAVMALPGDAGASAASARLARPRLFAPFIAQIAAIAAGAPQTRIKRRAPACEAASAYAAGQARAPGPPARLLRES